MAGGSCCSSRRFSIGEPITLTAEHSSKSMQLDLDDEEKLALLNLLTDAIETDRYPLSPRVQVLWRILAKLGPIGPTPPPPARSPTAEGARSGTTAARISAAGEMIPVRGKSNRRKASRRNVGTHLGNCADF